MTAQSPDEEAVNYDEACAGAYSLPDPLCFADGRRELFSRAIGSLARWTC